MGTFFSFALGGVGGGISFVQSWHYGSRAEKLTRLAHELDYQGLRLDVLGTIREEVRDQVFVIMSNLDNSMLVSTLMLSIGFGFVVEGTFPPNQAESLKDWKIDTIGFSIDPLVAYAILCALSLIFPFWSLVFTIRMRYEVDGVIAAHMTELKRQLCNVLRRKVIQAPHETCDDCSGHAAPQLHSQKDATNALRSLCPRRLRSIAGRKCPQRVQQDLERTANHLAKHVGPFAIANEMKSIEEAQILKWAESDLMVRLQNHRFYICLTRLCIWLGIVSSIFTCSVLLGIYMRENYPNTPLMWFVYSHIVGINGGLAVIFAAYCWLRGAISMFARTSISNKSNRLWHWSSSSTGPSNALSTPLLEPLQRMASRPSLVSEPIQTPGHKMSLKVRQAGVGAETFRRVVLHNLSEAGPATFTFEELEERICNKFVAKGPGFCASNAGRRAERLTLLVRLRDALELIDDEDVQVLKEGDELEATFEYA